MAQFHIQLRPSAYRFLEETMFDLPPQNYQQVVQQQQIQEERELAQAQLQEQRRRQQEEQAQMEAEQRNRVQGY